MQAELIARRSESVQRLARRAVSLQRPAAGQN